MHTSKNESGRSLIEMLGTIAIITMITLGGIAGVRVAMDSYRTNALADQVEQVSQNIMDLYSWKKTFSGVGTDSFWVNNCKDVLADCKNGKWDVSTGGQMSVASSNRGFKIIVTNIGFSGCNTLKSKKWAFISEVKGTCPKNRYNPPVSLTFVAE